MHRQRLAGDAFLACCLESTAIGCATEPPGVSEEYSCWSLSSPILGIPSHKSPLGSLVSHFLVFAIHLPLADVTGGTEHCWGLRADCGMEQWPLWSVQAAVGCFCAERALDLKVRFFMTYWQCDLRQRLSLSVWSSGMEPGGPQ